MTPAVVKPRRGALSKFPQEATTQAVHVQWLDSWGGTEKWETRYDEGPVLDIRPIDTIGFLVGIDEVWVAVAQSMAEEQIGNVLRIPKAAIVDFNIIPEAE